VEKTAEILILDDEPIVGDRLKPALEKCGYTVETLTDSQEAIERLAHKRYDLLITDLKMSGPSGLDVLRFVKEQSPRTGVIVITGYATAEQAKESIKGGAVDFIAKPFRISHLTELVTRTLEKVRPQTV
jgi:DNA-binding NtrC family response regulator